MWRHKIWALTWKNFQIRKRKPIIFIVEMLTCILFFVVLYMFQKSLRNISDTVAEVTRQQMNEPEDLFEKLYTPVCYGPNQTWTRDIMMKVATTLKMTKKRQPQPCGNLSDTRNIPQIEFKDDIDLPDRLVYVMNVRGAGDIHDASPLDDHFTPHRYFADQYKDFAALQGAINKAYIELKSGKNVTQKFRKEEFPFPESKSANAEAIYLLFTFVFICSWFSLLSYSIIFIGRILEEKLSGIAEMVKMFGVDTSTLWQSHMINSIPVYLAYSIVNTILLSLMVKLADPVLFWLTLTLYFISMTTLSLLIAVILRSNSYLALTLVLIHTVLLTVMGYVKPYMEVNNRSVQWLGGVLIPHLPLRWIWDGMAFNEAMGNGAQWGNIFKSTTPLSPPIGQCFLLLHLQSWFYYYMAKYVSNVFPGTYGIPKPWDYIFKVDGILPSKVAPPKALQEDDPEAAISVDKDMFEPIPSESAVGVSVRNVSKVFGSTRALKNVTFDVLVGEITVLLGHNGAGKTTIMSIITGMYGATEGEVYVEGVNTKSGDGGWRNKLGLCPQHNVVFPGVNVAEQVIIFGMFKGIGLKEAKQNSVSILKQVKLTEKAAVMSEKLSGGMKRRLQLACACAGDAEILVLDEPTSGLDVQTRRELWDLLLSMRGNRSVLLSTHFMEEADALADRVAAMNGGRLVAHATPMYLKRVLGSGFVLTLNLKPENKRDDIQDAITSEVPAATIKKENKKSIAFNLPSKETEAFPEMFKTLENNKEQLGIESMGVGVTTLEEVFLKLCSDVDETKSEDMTDHAIPDMNFKPVRAPMLWLNQTIVLLKREAKHVWHSKCSFLVMNVLVSIGFIFLLTYYTTEKNASPPRTNLRLSLDVYPRSSYESTNKVLMKLGAGYEDSGATLANAFPAYQFQQSKDLISDILRVGENPERYKNLYVGIELNNETATAMYTTIARHALPISVDVLSNALADHYLGPSEKSRFTTETTIKVFTKEHITQAKSLVNCKLWGAIFAVLSLGFLSAALMLAVIERVTGVRHSHVMAGCSISLHWFVRLIWFLVLYLLVIQLWTIIAVLTLDSDNTFTSGDFIGWLLLLSTLGALANLAFIFFFSQLNDSHSGLNIALMVLIIVYGFFIPFTGIELGDKAGSQLPVVWQVGYILPLFHSFMAIGLLSSHARITALCQLNKSMCRNGQISGLLDLTTEQIQQCCSGTGPSMIAKAPTDYFDITHHVLYLLLCFFAYMTLTILIDSGYFRSLSEYITNFKYTPSLKKYRDAMVEDERKYVESKITTTSSTSGTAEDIALVNDVHKCYRSFPWTSHRAVRGVSFSVKRGECFGLLGVNGAGKTTIFKMLVAAEKQTRGKMQAGGFDQDSNKSKYLTKLTYCPQFGGFDEFMDCASNVATMLTLRGLPRSLVDMETKKWLAVVGLDGAHGKVGTFSGGRKRRAATCIALAGASREDALALLDEPTSGVDPAAAKHMWRAISASQLSIILTSHSMQETEAMCSRIGIVARGELGALGTAGQLRDSRANGFTAVLKLNQETPEGGIDGVRFEKLKAQFSDLFPSVLQDEHKSMLQYRITDSTIKYSELFGKLEGLKEKYEGLVEDYSVANCTLEEVFLSFAKDSDVKSRSKSSRNEDSISTGSSLASEP